MEAHSDVLMAVEFLMRRRQRTSSLTSLDYYDNGDEWATAAAAVTEAATVPTVSSENTHKLLAGLVNENLKGIPLDEIILMPKG